MTPSPKFAAALAMAMTLAAPDPARADLLVSSFSGNRVMRYNDATGAFLSVFVANNAGGLSLPHGLAVGPDGNVYVASAGSDAILRYNGTNGAFIDVFATDGLDYPVWLEFRPDGFLYVSSQLNNCVARFNATNGAFAGLFVTNDSGGISGPSGMAWGPEGHLYVVGRSGHHVKRYHGATGAFLDTFAAGHATNGIVQPFGIRFGPDALAYVVSGNNNRVARFDPVTGAYLGVFAPNPAGASSGNLSLPVGLDFGPDGHLYVASFNNNKIARFNGASGIYLNDFVASGSGGLASPNFFLFRPQQTYGTNIAGVGPAGPIERRHVGFQFTEGPAADANGHVYFTDVQAGRIYKSDTNGLLSIFLTNSRACNGLIFDQAGRLIACQRDLMRIIAIDTATTNITPRATNWNGRPFIGPNDLVVDSAGGAYFTDPNFASGQTGATQSVYYASAAGVVSQVAGNLSRPNGVILSPDETRLHVVLSGAANLVSYPVNSPGVLGAPSVMPIPGTGDGMTLDTLGRLYLCQPGSSSILVLSAQGATLGSIPIPEVPANCTFGGRDMRTLFVTARTGLYAVRMAATGHRFAWNPASYADFQAKFFNSTNLSAAQPSSDADADGASNLYEYLTRTHPLCGGDVWRAAISRNGGLAGIRFAQPQGRLCEVLFSTDIASTNPWPLLAVPGNPPPVTTTNRQALIADDLNAAPARSYRVRVSAP